MSRGTSWKPVRRFALSEKTLRTIQQAIKRNGIYYGYYTAIYSGGQDVICKAIQRACDADMELLERPLAAVVDETAGITLLRAELLA